MRGKLSGMWCVISLNCAHTATKDRLNENNRSQASVSLTYARARACVCVVWKPHVIINRSQQLKAAVAGVKNRERLICRCKHKKVKQVKQRRMTTHLSGRTHSQVIACVSAQGGGGSTEKSFWRKTKTPKIIDDHSSIELNKESTHTLAQQLQET